MHREYLTEIHGGDAPLAAVGAVYLPPAFTAHYRDDDAGAPDVAITFEIRDGVPVCTKVQITATPDGHEVRHSGIVGVRIEDALDMAVKNMLQPAAVVQAHVREAQQARSSRRVTITEARLREVADVYRTNIADKPTAAVADHFGVAHRTAALYVQRAREAGHLPKTRRGKAEA